MMIDIDDAGVKGKNKVGRKSSEYFAQLKKGRKKNKVTEGNMIEERNN